MLLSLTRRSYYQVRLLAGPVGGTQLHREMMCCMSNYPSRPKEAATQHNGSCNTPPNAYPILMTILFIHNQRGRYVISKETLLSLPGSFSIPLNPSASSSLKI